jgi:transcriptional regulator with XRE-family HTH domain
VAARAQSKITGAQLEAARKLLGWTYRELAERCGVSLGSITRLTMAPDWPLRARPETLAAIERALEEAGVEFILPNEGGAGVGMHDRRQST